MNTTEALLKLLEGNDEAAALALLEEHPDAARGAELNALSQNSTGNTPLSATIAGAGNFDIVQLMLARGADVNLPGAGGFTPLHLAASRGAEPLVLALLESGADPTAKAHDGNTPADVAASRGHAETSVIVRQRATR